MSHQSEDQNRLSINSNTGVVSFNGKLYKNPRTLEAENDNLFHRPIPLELFKTIDFSQIESVHILTEGYQLAVKPVGWTTVFFRKVA